MAEPEQIILEKEDLHLVGHLAVVTAILTASGGLDAMKARAEGRRILREAVLDVSHLRDVEVIR